MQLQLISVRVPGEETPCALCDLSTTRSSGGKEMLLSVE